MNILATISNIIALTLVNVQQSLLSAGTAISGWMFTIAIGLAGVGWAFRNSNIVVTGGFAAAGALLVLMTLAASQVIGEMLMSGTVALALRAGGNGMGVDAYLSMPDAWLQSGWAAAQRLADFGDVNPSIEDITMSMLGLNSEIKWAFWIASWFVYIVFAIAALIMIVSMFFYKIGFALGMLTVPLVVIGATRRFGLAPLNFAMHSLASMFALVFVLSLSSNLMTRINADIPLDPTMMSILPPVVGSLFILMSVFGARHLAHSMMGAGIASVGSLFGPAFVAGAMLRNTASNSVRGAIAGGPAGAIAGGASGLVGGSGKMVSQMAYVAQPITQTGSMPGSGAAPSARSSGFTSPHHAQPSSSVRTSSPSDTSSSHSSTSSKWHSSI